MCFLVFDLTLFYSILEYMTQLTTNVRKFFFLVIFDTCDVVYNWTISLLPPILLDNLFEINPSNHESVALFHVLLTI